MSGVTWATWGFSGLTLDAARVSAKAGAKTRGNAGEHDGRRRKRRTAKVKQKQRGKKNPPHGEDTNKKLPKLIPHNSPRRFTIPVPRQSPHQRTRKVRSRRHHRRPPNRPPRSTTRKMPRQPFPDTPLVRHKRQSWLTTVHHDCTPKFHEKTHSLTGIQLITQIIARFPPLRNPQQKTTKVKPPPFTPIKPPKKPHSPTIAGYR